MKIVTVTMVKNEENIIESFVRHAIMFSDTVIVFNHNSTDGTLAILEALKKEFESRVIIYPAVLDAVMTINQEMFNHMIRYAFEQLNADMVLPLDSDEFPLLLNGGDIRSYLEGLSLEQCYRAHFIPFAISDEWKKDVFTPLLFKRRKKISKDTDFKVFLTRKPYFEYGLEVGLGNHILGAREVMPDDLIKDLYPELFYAHFAFRNREHLESKLVIRWLSLIMRGNIMANMAFQYRIGYSKIIQGQKLSQEEIDWFSLNNMCSGVGDVETEESIQKMIEETDTHELFEEVELKYTDLIQEKSSYVLLMEFAEQVISQYKEEKSAKEKLISDNRELELMFSSEKDRLENELANVRTQLNEFQKSYAQLEQQYTNVNNNLKSIRESKAWKLIQTYRKIVGKHDPTQD